MIVLHVITNLGQGGAETVLHRVITATRPDVEHIVVSLMGEAYFGPRLRAAGVQVSTLDKPRGRVTIRGLLKLRRLIVETRPDAVQTWMYHADLVGGLVARSAGVRSVVWGIHQSNLAADMTSFSARVSARICARLSAWLPAAIVSCSVHSARVHQAFGYRAGQFIVIPNGYDLSYFAPDAEARCRVRAEWGVAPNTTLLGMVARWDPQKDHENLLRALTSLVERGSNFRCVLVGTEMDRDNTNLVGLIEHLSLADRIILAGPRNDIPAVMNSLDLHVLSSAGEAFPNAVAEAMACGTPCVVTDVGDAALIVGDTGWVVPPEDAEALAGAILQALAVVSAEGREEFGGECRTRIEENFSLKKMAGTYLALWKTVAKSGESES